MFDQRFLKITVAVLLFHVRLLYLIQSGLARKLTEAVIAPEIIARIIPMEPPQQPPAPEPPKPQPQTPPKQVKVVTPRPTPPKPQPTPEPVASLPPSPTAIEAPPAPCPAGACRTAFAARTGQYRAARRRHRRDRLFAAASGLSVSVAPDG